MRFTLCWLPCCLTCSNYYIQIHYYKEMSKGGNLNGMCHNRDLIVYYMNETDYRVVRLTPWRKENHLERRSLFNCIFCFKYCEYSEICLHAQIKNRFGKGQTFQIKYFPSLDNLRVLSRSFIGDRFNVDLNFLFSNR